MKKIILVFTLMMLMTTSVFAALDLSQETLTNTELLKAQANAQLASIPGSARFFIGNQRVNIDYTPNEGEVIHYGVIIRGRTVQSVELNSLSNPDLEVRVSESALTQIESSQNPRAEAKNLIDNGQISYTAHGFVTRMKVRMALRFL